MSCIFEFLIAYWKELFYGFCAFLSLLCLIFRKCKIKLIDSAFEQAVLNLPRWISAVEFIFSDGITKKKFVISQAINFICDMTHKSFKEVSDQYETKLSDAVENILSTPTKKGELCENKNEKIH